MDHKSKKKNIPFRVIIAGVAIVITAFILFSLFARPNGENSEEMPLFEVQRGPLTIDVTESGTIQAREQVILKSEVEGRTTIIYLIQEGTLVEKGELLVELDSSEMQDDLIEQEIRLQNADADFVQARENLAVVKSQAESDIAKAKLNLQFAKEDLEKYLEGEYPTQLKEKESEITLKKEELERARQKMQWSEKLYQEKYISQTERDSDRLAANRAELQYELAQDDLELFKEYTHQRKLTELKSDLEQKEMELERTKRKATADTVQAEARLKAREAELLQQKSRLQKTKEQIEKTKITAPINGMVVYATSARHSWRGNDEPLDEGQEVREREELIYLPTADTMSASIKIHESSLKKVKLGQPVNVYIDALPGKTFTGKVTKIAPLPDPQSMWLNPDLKVFTTTIELDQDGSEMRTGMSCRAEIIVNEYDDVLYAPVQSVIRKGNQHMAYVRNGGRIEARPVEIGLDNNRMVHIKKGLNEGESVVLTPPLETAGSMREKEAPEQAADSGTKEEGASVTAKGPVQPSERSGGEQSGKRPSFQGNKPQGGQRSGGQRPSGSRKPSSQGGNSQ